MNETPETLRMGLPFPVGEQPDEQAWYDAHAAAWEADIAQRKALEKSLKTCSVADANGDMDIRAMMDFCDRVAALREAQHE